MAALAATTAAGGTGVAFCKGAQLSGSFAAVRGSAGAGSISYQLRLKNASHATCSVTGLPRGQLLGRHGGNLPTHVQAAFPGALASVLVTLHPDQSTRATARFSPDVFGTGDAKTPGQCEPTAYGFRVAASVGTVTVKLLPPTPVCERGRLQFSAYSL